MPQPRSKKGSSSRKTEEDTAPELEEREFGQESDDESLDLREKDSDEEELDRLVLGDGAGFMAQLGVDMDVDEEDDIENGDAHSREEEEGEAALEGVDDADVRMVSNVL
jgi:U3 small nucleolar RNA-associated protein 18